ncbi:MAG: hypothetical protein M3N29_00305, partial [Chloroflexota bacterium]|nr:hypothetical protein [Chloroflexota bacterium]
MDIYLEGGRRRVFAAALSWPGWARSGRDEEAAMQALVDYGERYRRAIGRGGGDLALPTSAAELHVAEPLSGGATTDFGAPGAIAAHDEQPPDDVELERLSRILTSCWEAFDRALEAAAGRPLQPAGPRGGGRSVSGVRDHVMAAQLGYLSSLGGWTRPGMS